MRGASVWRGGQAVHKKPVQWLALRWLAVVLLLGLVLAWLMTQHSSLVTNGQQAVRLQIEGSPRKDVLPAPASPPVAPPAVSATRLGVVQEDSCESIAVQGAHTATSIEDARIGSVEDIRDVCPLSRVEQLRETCSATMANDASGVPQQVVRCMQAGVCHMCGEHLSRRRELMEKK